MATKLNIPKYDPTLLEKFEGTNSKAAIHYRGYTAESLLRAYRSGGPVIETEINGETVYVLAGIDANQTAWTTPDSWSYHHAVAVFREELSELHLTQLDRDRHRRKRRLLNKGFKQSSVMAGMPAMARTIGAELARMEGRELEMHQGLMQTLTKAQASCAVKESFSEEEVARMVDFEEGFIGALFLKQHEREIIYNRSSYLGIKQTVLERLHRIVRERMDGVTRDDLLDGVIHQKVSANMEGLTEEELIYDTYLLLIAGTGNTSKLICHLLHALTEHPAWTERLKEELKDFDPRRLAGGMKDFPLLKATLMETERCFPAAPVLPRVPSTDIDFLGYTLPAGSACLHMVTLMHFNEEIYEDPFEFKPERWLDHDYPRAAHGVFGGGTHVCLGMNIARIHMPLCIGYILSGYDYEITHAPRVEAYAHPDEADAMTLRMNVRLTKK